REGPASTASHLACCGIRKPTETPGFVPVTPPLVSWLQWESMKYPLTTMTPGPADTNGESVDQLNVARAPWNGVILKITASKPSNDDPGPQLQPFPWNHPSATS